MAGYQLQFNLELTPLSHLTNFHSVTTDDVIGSSENVQRSDYNFLIRSLDAKKKSNPTSGRKKKILSTTTLRRTTERKRTEDDETEQRRDERVLLHRVFDRLGGLSARPSGRPVSRLPKTPPMGPGPAGAQNRHILNRTLIKKSSDSDGRRIREFSSSRTCLDLLLFRALGGTHFRVPFLRVFVSRIRNSVESTLSPLGEFTPILSSAHCLLYITPCKLS